MPALLLFTNEEHDITSTSHGSEELLNTELRGKKIMFKASYHEQSEQQAHGKWFLVQTEKKGILNVWTVNDITEAKMQYEKNKRPVLQWSRNGLIELTYPPHAMRIQVGQAIMALVHPHDLQRFCKGCSRASKQWCSVFTVRLCAHLFPNTKATYSDDHGDYILVKLNVHAIHSTMMCTVLLPEPLTKERSFSEHTHAFLTTLQPYLYVPTLERPSLLGASVTTAKSFMSYFWNLWSGKR